MFSSTVAVTARLTSLNTCAQGVRRETIPRRARRPCRNPLLGKRATNVLYRGSYTRCPAPGQLSCVVPQKFRQDVKAMVRRSEYQKLNITGLFGGARYGGQVGNEDESDNLGPDEEGEGDNEVDDVLATSMLKVLSLPSKNCPYLQALHE